LDDASASQQLFQQQQQHSTQQQQQPDLLHMQTHLRRNSIASLGLAAGPTHSTTSTTSHAVESVSAKPYPPYHHQALPPQRVVRHGPAPTTITICTIPTSSTGTTRRQHQQQQQQQHSNNSNNNNNNNNNDHHVVASPIWNRYGSPSPSSFWNSTLPSTTTTIGGSLLLTHNRITQHQHQLLQHSESLFASRQNHHALPLLNHSMINGNHMNSTASYSIGALEPLGSMNGSMNTPITVSNSKHAQHQLHLQQQQQQQQYQQHYMQIPMLSASTTNTNSNGINIATTTAQNGSSNSSSNSTSTPSLSHNTHLYNINNNYISINPSSSIACNSRPISLPHQLSIPMSLSLPLSMSSASTSPLTTPPMGSVSPCVVEPRLQLHNGAAFRSTLIQEITHGDRNDDDRVMFSTDPFSSISTFIASPAVAPSALMMLSATYPQLGAESDHSEEEPLLMDLSSHENMDIAVDDPIHHHMHLQQHSPEKYVSTLSVLGNGATTTATTTTPFANSATNNTSGVGSEYTCATGSAETSSVESISDSAGANITSKATTANDTAHNISTTSDVDTSDSDTSDSDSDAGIANSTKNDPGNDAYRDSAGNTYMMAEGSDDGSESGDDGGNNISTPRLAALAAGGSGLESELSLLLRSGQSGSGLSRSGSRLPLPPPPPPPPQPLRKTRRRPPTIKSSLSFTDVAAKLYNTGSTEGRTTGTTANGGNMSLGSGGGRRRSTGASAASLTAAATAMAASTTLNDHQTHPEWDRLSLEDMQLFIDPSLSSKDRKLIRQSITIRNRRRNSAAALYPYSRLSSAAIALDVDSHGEGNNSAIAGGHRAEDASSTLASTDASISSPSWPHHPTTTRTVSNNSSSSGSSNSSSVDHEGNLDTYPNGSNNVNAQGTVSISAVAATNTATTHSNRRRSSIHDSHLQQPPLSRRRASVSSVASLVPTRSHNTPRSAPSLLPHYPSSLTKGNSGSDHHPNASSGYTTPQQQHARRSNFRASVGQRRASLQALLRHFSAQDGITHTAGEPLPYLKSPSTTSIQSIGAIAATTTTAISTTASASPPVNSAIFTQIHSLLLDDKKIDPLVKTTPASTTTTALRSSLHTTRDHDDDPMDTTVDDVMDTMDPINPMDTVVPVDRCSPQPQDSLSPLSPPTIVNTFAAVSLPNMAGVVAFDHLIKPHAFHVSLPRMSISSSALVGTNVDTLSSFISTSSPATYLPSRRYAPLIHPTLQHHTLDSLFVSARALFLQATGSRIPNALHTPFASKCFACCATIPTATVAFDASTTISGTITTTTTTTTTTTHSTASDGSSTFVVTADEQLMARDLLLVLSSFSGIR
ncbi:hypothetical protein BASA61_003654, partial [Batrachochytrium salamandrivorans]